MIRFGRHVYKIADTALELEQVHRLNYQTFVQEIPQHDDNGSGRLVDKFHDKNIYFVGRCGDQVVGMLSAHDQPPFSITERLPDPSLITKPGMKPLEVRLLAVEPTHRNSFVTTGLVWSLFTYARAKGYTHLAISGIVSQLPLYTRMGFEPLGPPVGDDEAKFIPMMVSLDRLELRMSRGIALVKRRLEREARECEPVSFLPGPVPLSPAVRAAFQEAPIYHRGSEFIDRYERLRRSLARLVGARDVGILVGSGTLGNEAVAAALAAGPQPQSGLLLVNGEFGRRLTKQAMRFGLRPKILNWSWGLPWNLDEVAASLDELPPGGWVWGVHQESSTGVLNDLPGLVSLARARGIRVCVDCVSSIGAVPIDLSEVYLATGTSGKALGSYAGLALIFADPAKLNSIDCDRVPSYFDLAATFSSSGPRYTVPSPLVRALETAMLDYDSPAHAKDRYTRFAELALFVRRRLRELGLPPMADESCSSPVITTFCPPGNESAVEFVNKCLEWGFLIGGQSGYLAELRLAQIANMGNVQRDDLARLFENMETYLKRYNRKVIASA